MKRRVLVLLMLILIVGLVGCAKTKVSDVFRFEVRKLEMTLYADEEKNIEKELGLVRGAIDANAEIVYTMSYIDGENVGEVCFENEVLEIIEVSPYVNDSGIIAGTIIADQNENVKIRAKGEGQIRLTAFLKDSPNVTDSIIVTVTKEVLSGIKINAPEDTKILYVGEKIQLTVDTFPNHIESEYKFESSNILEATVSQTGLVTGVAPTKSSDVIIKATSKYDPNVFATYAFKVLYEDATGVEVKANDKVVEADEVVKLTKNDELQLSAKVLSEKGLAKDAVTYKSSDTKVVTVSDSGLIKAVNGGTAKITVTPAESSVSLTFSVEVGYKPSEELNLKFDQQEVGTEVINVSVKKTYSFTVEVSPILTANQDVTIEVASDEYKDFVKIDGLKITPLKDGEFTLIVSTKDETPITPITKEVKFKAEYDAVEKVEITSGQKDLVVGDTYQVTVKVTPTTSKQEVTYSSSDESIATVDASGKVTTLKEGTVTITVTSVADAEKKATITLTIAKESE